MSEDRQARARVLTAFGASAAAVEELLAHNDNPFRHPVGGEPVRFPPPPEAHVETWTEYASLARERGAWAVLRERLVQLRFPVRAGISETEAYRNATRRGLGHEEAAEVGLVLGAPEKLRLWLHPCAAGVLPVLCTSERQDFVRLLQALSCRNEPEPVPAAVGACLVSGFNNWDRIRRHRQRWSAEAARPDRAATWDEEFQRILPHKELYQDRFLILSEGPYSGVAAEDLGLAADTWQRLSLTVRLEHECTHYFTLRLFGAARNHVLDELIADYAGIVAACGRYRGDWFLRFLGLEAPLLRESGRLANYRGKPPLSDEAFLVQQALVRAAAANLERFDASLPAERRGGAAVLAALCRATLEELASPAAETLLRGWLEGTKPCGAR